MPNQQDGSFVRNFANSVTSPSQPQQQSQSDIPTPLPTIDPVTPNQDGTQGSGQTGTDQPPLNGAAGARAATADFQGALGHGWEYDSEAMQAQIARLEDLLDGTLWNMKQYTARITGILAPGSEVVSRNFTHVANLSGESHNAQFARYEAYLQSYIDTLYEIDRAYREQDQAALEALKEAEV